MWIGSIDWSWWFQMQSRERVPLILGLFRDERSGFGDDKIWKLLTAISGFGEVAKTHMKAVQLRSLRVSW